MHNDVIVARSLVLLHLSSGNTLCTVVFQYWKAYNYFEDGRRQRANIFVRFSFYSLHTLIGLPNQVAWSVARSVSVNGPTHTILFAILVNENNVWDSVNNWVNIPGE